VRLLILAGMAGALLGSGVLAVQARRAGARALEMRRRERDQAEAAARAARAADEQQRALERAVERLQPRPTRIADLLAALARATPPEVTLQAATCAGDRFELRGRVHESGAAAAALLQRYRRELAGDGAGWVLAPVEPGGGAPANFTWDGRFLRPEPPPLTLPGWEDRLAAAQAAEPTVTTFEAWLAAWGGRWVPTGGSEEIWPDLVLRHYAFASADRRLGAWSAIVAALQAASRQPGVTVDSVALAVPETGERFTQADVTLTARLRP
jgi:hypothetical protein